MIARHPPPQRRYAGEKAVRGAFLIEKPKPRDSPPREETNTVTKEEKEERRKGLPPTHPIFPFLFPLLLLFPFCLPSHNEIPEEEEEEEAGTRRLPISSEFDEGFFSTKEEDFFVLPMLRWVIVMPDHFWAEGVCPSLIPSSCY